MHVSVHPCALHGVHILHTYPICIQVLATGLSGLYSELPSSREIEVDDWQSPLPVIEAAVPELRQSTQALNFCNSVLQVWCVQCAVC